MSCWALPRVNAIRISHVRLVILDQRITDNVRYHTADLAQLESLPAESRFYRQQNLSEFNLIQHSMG